MVCDALGTRSVSTAKTFVHSLAQLCSQNFHPSGVEGEYGEWAPNELELNMVLNICTSIKPRNEMEAALAAQMTAVHLATMTMAARAMAANGADDRAAALLAKLARTFTLQWEGLMRSRGKRRTTRQNIVVTQEKHVHHHQHVRLDRREEEIGGQPCEPSDDDTAGNIRSTALVEHEGRSALPGANSSGIVVSMPSQEGQAPVPITRRSGRLRSAKGSR
jgi:hypothetical protein